MEETVFFIAKTVNSIGLGLDLVGVLLIWKYGLPRQPPGVDTVVVTAGSNDELEKAESFYKIMGNVGLGFIVCGFLIQAISNHI